MFCLYNIFSTVIFKWINRVLSIKQRKSMIKMLIFSLGLPTVFKTLQEFPYHYSAPCWVFLWTHQWVSGSSNISAARGNKWMVNTFHVPLGCRNTLQKQPLCGTNLLGCTVGRLEFKLQSCSLWFKWLAKSLKILWPCSFMYKHNRWKCLDKWLRWSPGGQQGTQIETRREGLLRKTTGPIGSPFII